MQHMHHHGMDPQAHQNQMHDMCKNYHLHFVQIQMADGHMHDGIIEEVDQEGVTLLIPHEDMQHRDEEGEQHPYGFEDSRGPYGYGPGGGPGFAPPGYGPGPGPGFGPPGYGPPGYGPRPRYPRRFRRFRRHRFPFAGLGRLFFPLFY